MTNKLRRAPLLVNAITLALCLLTPAHAQVTTKLTPPPAAELSYQIKSSQKGIPISGKTTVSWTITTSTDGKKNYRIHSQTRVPIFGRILSTSSEGEITEQGLLPGLFKEKRMRKDESQTRFNRDSNRITFSDSDLEYAIKGGEQDRLSATWQLVTLLRSQQAPLKLGQTWEFLVAGAKDADPWRFTLLELGKQNTALGELEVVHLLKSPHADAQGQRVELWLAPALDFYPVRISFHDANGDDLEQKISAVKKMQP